MNPTQISLIIVIASVLIIIASVIITIRNVKTLKRLEQIRKEK